MKAIKHYFLAATIACAAAASLTFCSTVQAETKPNPKQLTAECFKGGYELERLLKLALSATTDAEIEMIGGYLDSYAAQSPVHAAYVGAVLSAIQRGVDPVVVRKSFTQGCLDSLV